MKYMTLMVPDNLNLNVNATKRFFFAKMYASGKHSLGQAAELAELSKVAFLRFWKTMMFQLPLS